MEYNVYDYISEKYLPGSEQSLWPLMYREGVVISGSSQGLMKQFRDLAIPGELDGILEDCPGLTLPLGRGDPKDGS